MTSNSKSYDIPFTMKLADFVKALLPQSLHAPARAVWRRLFRLRARYYEAKLWTTLWLHKLRGGKYIDWYGDTLNRGAKSAAYIMEEMPEWIYESGADDLEAAKRLGLKPHHTLYEYGCGFLRSGNHFMRYLDAGNYAGNDAAGARVERGKEIFKDLIAEKRASLFVTRDNTLSWINRKFDYIWCHAVFGHMPEKDIEEAIRNIRKIMHEGSVFIFSYDPLPEKYANELSRREDARDWWHSLRFYEQIAAKDGMVVEDVSWAIRDLKSWRPHIDLAKMVIEVPEAARK
jgi:hypothetical protein